MNVLNFTLLAFAHYLTGWGIIRALGFKDAIKSFQLTLIAIIFGLGISSIFPLILEIFSVPINTRTLSVMFLASTIIPAFFWARSFIRLDFKSIFNQHFNKLRLYDLVFLGVLAYLMFTGMEKCFYCPPTPRDLTSGAEAIAEYTIKEQRINNSYFSIDLSSTDNYQKPPFLLGLQIVYKLFVHQFGQVWLILLSGSFYLFLYSICRKMVHPIIAAIATIMVLCVPEFYGYIIMPLFDFPNTVYLFAGFYYLYTFLINDDRKSLLLCAVAFGMATMARPETIFLVIMICIFYYLYQVVCLRKIISWHSFFICLILVIPSILTDVFTMEIFVKHYIPSGLSFSAKFNPDLTNFKPLMERWHLLTSVLMFSTDSSTNFSKIYYGETFNIMILFMTIELLFIMYHRKLDFNAAVWFSFLLLVFFLLLITGYLFLWTEFTNAKRGLFKMLPLIFVFAINTRFIQMVSNKIKTFEIAR